MPNPDRAISFNLHPLDTLFFRDGREFGSGGRAQSGLPHPQTLLGALRGELFERWGVDFAKFRIGVQEAAQELSSGQSDVNEEGLLRRGLENAGASEAAWVLDLKIAGPWLHREQKGALSERLLLRAPAHLRRSKRDDGKLFLARPWSWLESAARVPAGMEGALLVPHAEHQGAQLERVKGWLSLAQLQQILHATLAEDSPTIDDVEVVAPEKLYGFDQRVGIGIDDQSKSTDEGLIYSAGMLALQAGVSFFAQILGADDALSHAASILKDTRTLRWGGEGRRVRLSNLDRQANALFLSRELPPLAYISTPMPGRVVKDTPSTIVASEEAIAHSGWSMVFGGPRRTKRYHPEGTMLFGASRDSNLSIDDSRLEAWERAMGLGTLMVAKNAATEGV